MSKLYYSRTRELLFVTDNNSACMRYCLTQWCHILWHGVTLRSIPFYDCLSSQICAAETVINKGNLMWRVVYCIASPTQRMLFLSSVFIYKHGLMHLNHAKEIEVSKIWKEWTSTDLALAVTKERRSFEITPPPPMNVTSYVNGIEAFEYTPHLL